MQKYLLPHPSQNFRIPTIAEGPGRISHCPTNFYSHHIFLDQVNFGGVHFEQRDIEDAEESEMTDDAALYL